jgi:hypothetical protein
MHTFCKTDAHFTRKNAYPARGNHVKYTLLEVAGRGNHVKMHTFCSPGAPEHVKMHTFYKTDAHFTRKNACIL